MKTTRPAQKIRIAVSACLLGQPVRYDGDSKKSEPVLALQEQFELISFCPEVAVGMGVPRLPIQLVKIDDRIQAQGVADPGRNATAALLNYADTEMDFLQQVCGIIFKSRSPSCGLGSTPVFTPEGEQTGNSNGLVTGIVQNKFPHLPLAEETYLQSADKRQQFIEQVYAYYKTLQAM